MIVLIQKESDVRSTGRCAACRARCPRTPQHLQCERCGAWMHDHCYLARVASMTERARLLAAEDPAGHAAVLCPRCRN